LYSCGDGEVHLGYTKSLIIAIIACQAVTTAMAGERRILRSMSAAVSGTKSTSQDGRVTMGAPLDRVAVAVDGAESSHGTDMGMWRPDPSGPQGPMQVSEAAATDVGGGDRFDTMQNRAIGRAYLAQLYWKYRNWPDAIAAYNWGIGKMDAWVKAGRPPDKFLVGVAAYLRRVLHESGLCGGSGATRGRQSSAGKPPRNISATAEAAESVQLTPDSLIETACSTAGAWGGAPGFGVGTSRFSKKLDEAMQLASQRARQSP
jgi:hypothetical protein